MWASADVMVTPQHGGWLVRRENVPGVWVSKTVCGDPQALADFVASQNPPARFTARRTSDTNNYTDNYGRWCVDDRLSVAGVFGGLTELQARTVADALNALEAP